MNRHRIIFIIGLSGILAAGCQHPGPRFNPYAPQTGATAELQGVTITNQFNPDWLRPPQSAFTLGPGDQIEIALIADPTSRTQAVVGPDGKIYFQLLPGLDVWGLTLPEVKALLEKQLSQYYRDQPRVSLTLRGVESRRVWLLGQVQTPGVYFMTNAMTLLEAIALAGGTVSLAPTKDLATVGSVDELTDLSRSFIVRKGQMLPVDFQRLVAKGDLSQNIYLEPDDFIYFPPATARDVYVIGAVGQPRAVPYMPGLTMAAAIADASGTIREAYLSHVAVVRGSLSQPRVALIDYKSVIQGETPDVLLQPHDIVYVPFEPYRYLRRYANLIMDTFVSSVAINEGVRSVTAEPIAPAGVFIPVGSRITVSPGPGGGQSFFTQ